MRITQLSPDRNSASVALGWRSNPPQHILVVEDDDDIRRINAEVLIDSGYHVDSAENGAVAWDALQLNNYDLMITDNDMPEVSGFDLLKKLCAARMALRVIMATGTLPAEEFTRHPWLQPVAVLIKPHTIEALLETVKDVLLGTQWWRPSKPLTHCGHADNPRSQSMEPSQQHILSSRQSTRTRPNHCKP